MSVTLALMGIGALVGGYMGYRQAGERAYDLSMQASLSARQLELLEKANAVQKDIISGNLSLGAMSLSAQNRNVAMEAAAASGAQANALGYSGLSGGTPFYAMDREIINRQHAVIEQNVASRRQLGNAYQQAVVDFANMDMNRDITAYQTAKIEGESGYASSFWGMALPTMTGAAQGAATASSVMGMGVQSGLITEDFLSSAPMFDALKDFRTPKKDAVNLKLAHDDMAARAMNERLNSNVLPGFSLIGQLKSNMNTGPFDFTFAEPGWRDFDYMMKSSKPIGYYPSLL